MVAGRFIAAALVLATGLFGACMPGVPAGSSGSGGAAAPASGGSSGFPGGGGAGAGSMGTGGGAGSLAAGTGGGGVGGAGGAAEACERSPLPRQPTGTTLELPIELNYEGKPFLYGEANAVTSTATVLPLNVRFYLSAVALLTSNGTAVPVDVITATDEIQPYGIFMFNAEDPTMQTLRVRAPAGTYSGVKFDLGLSVACNTGDAFSRTFPLSADSQMTWPHLVGYLFLRYEAQVSSGAGPSFPAAIHMGADLRDLSKPGAIGFRVAGTVAVPSTARGASKRLRLAMDQVFTGATTMIDVSDVPFFGGGPEMVAGERLRRTAPGLPLFVLGD